MAFAKFFTDLYSVIRNDGPAPNFYQQLPASWTGSSLDGLNSDDDDLLLHGSLLLSGRVHLPTGLFSLKCLMQQVHLSSLRIAVFQLKPNQIECSFQVLINYVLLITARTSQLTVLCASKLLIINSI